MTIVCVSMCTIVCLSMCTIVYMVPQVCNTMSPERSKEFSSFRGQG